MNISEETKWLLSFVNVGITAGKLAPPPDRFSEWKRRPAEDGHSDHAVGALLPPLSDFVSDDGWWWDKTTGKCLGRDCLCLTDPHTYLKLYTDLLGDKIKLSGTPDYFLTEVETNGKPSIRMVAFRLERIRLATWFVLYNSTKTNYWSVGHRILNDPIIKPVIDIGKNGNMIFGHDDVFPQISTAYLLGFIVNQKELHPLLKICAGCGRFWIAEKKRGRPRIFCTPECKKAFDQLPKKIRAERMKEYRKGQKKSKQRKEFKELIEMLKEWEESPTEAEKQAHEWIYTQGRTLKQYKDDYGV
ncbi:MAG: hypothetical protein Q7J15_08310 [Candidatus Desulfaltia sp.]|nr:hypothetical protein [Candidatus Desulfaltia sp.]